ncbi:MAG: hypothetical protein RBT39_19605, partial [Azoarcus sp.]|nr:hypothetical protein [Azoarcus sp.]
MVTVENLAPVVTVDTPPQDVQYSDRIADVTFTATDVSSIDTMNAQTSYSIDGGEFFAGLPDALTIVGELSFNGPADQQTDATWTLSGIADLAPGSYIIRVTVTDDDGSSGSADATIDVTREDAVPTYVGPLFVSTPSIDVTTAIVELRAVIQDVTLYPQNDDWDPHAGNVTGALVTFVNLDTDTVIAEDVPVQLIDPADPLTGVAIYAWAVDLGNADSASITVGYVVEGFYTCAEEETVITVSKPLQDFITG